MNNVYKIKAESPLLRPGITIETQTSEYYAIPVVKKLMEMVREINAEPRPAVVLPDPSVKL